MNIPRRRWRRKQNAEVIRRKKQLAKNQPGDNRPKQLSPTGQNNLTSNTTIIRIEKITPAMAAPRGGMSGRPPQDFWVSVTVPLYSNAFSFFAVCQKRSHAFNQPPRSLAGVRSFKLTRLADC